MENYGIQILKARYYSLKEKWMVANEEMISYPNEYSANAYNQANALMEEVRDCLSKLNVEVI